ncbi:MAG TPA: hypothetical protein VFA82_02215 [Gaiellaceae bacterium]|nr:hypothetical protein [Gaiellaceae bacterium]
MRYLPKTLRQWVIVSFGATGLGLLPWTAWLSATLSNTHESSHWDLAWGGFDTGLAVLFVATAASAYYRSPWVGAFAAALGTLLVTDAWFDVVLSSHWDERRYALLLAVLAELPAAAVCFWIALRTERFLRWVVVEAELGLAASGEGAPEGDLVGVLEIPADGQPAREPGDANTSA